jgi:hypothetical protein
MFPLDQMIGYFKEVASSLKFQASAAITFGTALIMVWLKEVSELKIFLTILFLFPTSMLVGSLIGKAGTILKNIKLRKVKALKDKLGLLSNYRFTDKLSELWPDQNFDGLGWDIYVDQPSRTAFIKDPCCLSCKTDMVIRMNSKRDGFYLECPDCKNICNVNDVGQTRATANASLQGHVRKNSGAYFNIFRL